MMEHTERVAEIQACRRQRNISDARMVEMAVALPCQCSARNRQCFCARIDTVQHPNPRCHQQGPAPAAASHVSTLGPIGQGVPGKDGKIFGEAHKLEALAGEGCLIVRGPFPAKRGDGSGMEILIAHEGGPRKFRTGLNLFAKFEAPTICSKGLDRRNWLSALPWGDYVALCWVDECLRTTYSRSRCY